ncbi:MAG: acyl-CoA thioesterase II [Gemmatimonadaceae bacterium]|jgi:acyl-CoA thioesterase-2|nr:acyl-CoA thioesterase II [Gemmatimonadaceae bacterium]
MTETTAPEPRSPGSVTPLVELLDLEPIEVNIYRGMNRDLGSGRVFGGQVFAQAVVAARRTVPADRELHSAHGYFILAGDLAAPIVYFVDTLRDGNSFTTRRVTAIQHGRAIFSLSASFHVAEDGLAHQMHAWPTVPPPESLTPELELIRQRAARIPDALRPVLTQDRPIDFRPIAPIDPFAPEPREPVRHTWFKAMGTLPDDPIIHQAVLAYASDHGLITTALHPHGVSFRTPGMQLASLDHSLWLHRPFRADEWLLYTMDSPVASGARGFTRGAIYSRDGTLVASVAQEGLMRMRTSEERPKP